MLGISFAFNPSKSKSEGFATNRLISRESKIPLKSEKFKEMLISLNSGDFNTLVLKSRRFRSSEIP